jgi:metal-sulfur cluster biosynthetic enzyme
MTKDEVLDILRKVIDPEIGINVVDLGLVYDVTIDDNRLDVDMTMTTAACPLGAYITDQADMLLRSYFPNAEVTVNLVWVPQWTPEMMSDAARQQLGWM